MHLAYEARSWKGQIFADLQLNGMSGEGKDNQNCQKNLDKPEHLDQSSSRELGM